MKKATLLALALAIPVTAAAADKDSVYTWGAWSQNIQPAAGPRIAIAPAAVSQPQVNFRPNENDAFSRAANQPATTTPSDNIVTGFGDISPDAELTPPPPRTTPPPPPRTTPPPPPAT